MHQVVQVGLPVPLRVDVDRQHHAREFPGEARPLDGFERVDVDLALDGLRLDQAFVQPVGVLVVPVDHGSQVVVEPVVDLALAALFVGGGLRLEPLGDVELVVEDGVAAGVLVDRGGAVPDPLAGHEDRHLHVDLERAHLEGRRVPVTQQVADEAAVLADGGGAGAVADAGGLDDGGVVAHGVDHADVAVVEDVDAGADDGLRAVRRLVLRGHGRSVLRTGSVVAGRAAAAAVRTGAGRGPSHSGGAPRTGRGSGGRSPGRRRPGARRGPR